ncbi:tyrosine-type recombinase/integrase [Silvibacterium dinghuense]|uniref:Tyr recombinase domain-containing protein n=1 Tax=Silvibacterium dinghuense TaxID=1560006 RepID=A0A4Q1S9S1_9BACT|nr:tyrosine-type recombinase/integrase [Silvibacterium dinghuense]RXS93679.1 hypothetical protein ESZ00_16580 [Silvibacterium dinghuense]GGH06725.1 hypothetical protein GCM10011586_23620 [Silvibacterium dinghuense]
MTLKYDFKAAREEALSAFGTAQRQHVISADMTLEETFEHYISLRSLGAHTTQGRRPVASYVSAQTRRMDQNHRKALLLFFQEASLSDIHWYDLKNYQSARSTGAEPFIRYRRPQDEFPRRNRKGEILAPPKGRTPCPVKPQQINQELATLHKILMYAETWSKDDQRYYRQLRAQNEGIARALTPEEQKLWLEASLSRQRWMIVHWWSVASINTCMGANELNGLRIGDINLSQQVVTVPWSSAKNKYRKRTIAIENESCLSAFEQLIARAYDRGSRDPQHHLFPIGKRGGHAYDPARHMTGSGIKREWNEVRAATNLPWVDPYGMRHTGATRLAEEGFPIDIIMARMGHATEEMRQHYTQISLSAQRRWMQAHSHATSLPDITDTSASIAEALQLLRIAGITPQDLAGAH